MRFVVGCVLISNDEGAGAVWALGTAEEVRETLGHLGKAKGAGRVVHPLAQAAEFISGGRVERAADISFAPVPMGRVLAVIADREGDGQVAVGAAHGVEAVFEVVLGQAPATRAA